MRADVLRSGETNWSAICGEEANVCKFWLMNLASTQNFNVMMYSFLTKNMFLCNESNGHKLKLRL